MATRGQTFTHELPHVELNSNHLLLGGNSSLTYTKQISEHVRQYKREPRVTTPCTVSITGTGSIFYTFGPSYPTPRVDNITNFKYSAPFTIDANKTAEGTSLYIAAFYTDGNGVISENLQSPVLVVNFNINKTNASVEPPATIDFVQTGFDCFEELDLGQLFLLPHSTREYRNRAYHRNIRLVKQTNGSWVWQRTSTGGKKIQAIVSSDSNGYPTDGTYALKNVGDGCVGDSGTLQITVTP